MRLMQISSVVRHLPYDVVWVVCVMLNVEFPCCAILDFENFATAGELRFMFVMSVIPFFRIKPRKKRIARRKK
jgi:hypothetical protein